MAASAGLPFFTPEEYFLGQPTDPNFSLSGWDPSTYLHPTPSPPPFLPNLDHLELIILVGSPASGKSTYYARHFAPAGYLHVNQDTLKTRAKCLAVAEAALREGKSCVIDNTNPAKRGEYVDMAKKLDLDVRVRVGWFVAEERVCRQNAVYRALLGEREMLPSIAFVMYGKNFVKPTVEEGESPSPCVCEVRSGTMS